MTGFAAAVQTALHEYQDLGFDTLPLGPGTKDKPLARAWQSRSPADMWQQAPADANIAIRCGGASRLAVLDCDEKNQAGTFANAQDLLFGLGYEPGSYPVIQTASGSGKHIYLYFDDSLPGQYRTLDKEFGAGEFRFGKGAYVVAPPSILRHGGNYRMIAGDLRQLPAIRKNDILPVLTKSAGASKSFNGSKSISRLAKAILHGNIPDRYNTRSEAEQALIVSLINSGFSFEEILDKFLRFPTAGKFAEMNANNPKNAIRWLRLSYAKGFTYANENLSPGREIALDAIAWANSRPWHGRTGGNDQTVFLAHAQIAYRAGKIVFAASSRDLAEMSGLSHAGAINATGRLLNMGYINLVTEAIATCANTYQINQSCTCQHTPTTLEYIHLASHDAFRYRGLGKSALQVWYQLQTEPLSIDELAAKTGRHRITIQSAVEKMSGIVDSWTGELVSMVEFDGDKWHACTDIDLDTIARLIGTSGKGAEQKKRHRAERKLHRRALAAGKN